MTRRMATPTRLVCALACALIVIVTVRTAPRTAQDARLAALRGVGQNVAQPLRAAVSDASSAGCVTCHTTTDEPSMHPSGTVTIGCTDCHGGNAGVSVGTGDAEGTAGYASAKAKAHPRPKNPGLWKTTANPERAYTEWLRESQEYIQFVNPGDLRVVDRTCAACHAAEVRNARTSMMTHGAMLWGAALYNNGAVPFKTPRYGESYAPDGTPQRLQSWPAPTAEEMRAKGVLPFLDPLPRWELSQPGNVLRVFERGGRKKGEVGNPAREEDPGRPEIKLSDRGFGTLLRTDPVFLGLQKTRLLDPLLSFPGTNDQPGDYRGSGCTACHVVYANDRSAVHSAQYAQFGNAGQTATVDPAMARSRSEASGATSIFCRRSARLISTSSCSTRSSPTFTDTAGSTARSSSAIARAASSTAPATSSRTTTPRSSARPST